MWKILTIAALLGVAPALAADVSLTYQARILDTNGQAINSLSSIEVSVWDDLADPDPAHQLWTHTYSMTPDGGYVTLALDGLDSTWFASPVYVQTRVGGNILGSRQVLRGAPTAAHATTAAAITVSTSAPANGCADGALILDQSVGGAGVLRACSGGVWNPPVADGLTQATAAVNCNSLHTQFPALGDGVYWIDPDANGSQAAFPAYCDMTTANGGWTLCLNSEFTAAAGSLFDETYQPIYPRNDDPFGYYDWCSTTHNEYLFSLADNVADTTYDLKTATVHLWDTTPFNSGGEWTEIGVQTEHANTNWIHADGLNVGCIDSHLQVSLFQHIDPDYRGLRGRKRGHIRCTVASGNPGNTLVIGSGCNYSSCKAKGSGPSQEWDTNVYPTYSQWTWRLTATAGNGNNTWNNGPFQEDRTLMFFR